MKRNLVAAAAIAVCALFAASLVAAQGRLSPQGGTLVRVDHGSAFTGSGTISAPLQLTPQECAGSGSAVAGWGSDGTPTCVAAGATYSAGDGLDLSGTVFSLLAGCDDGQVPKRVSGAWTCAADADSGDITSVTATAPISGGGTSGDVSVGLTLCGNGSWYKSVSGVWQCGSLPSTSCAAGEAVTSIISSGQGTCSAVGDITGVTTTSPLSGGCTSGTCALTTSMSTARILGRTSASTGVVEQLTGTQATAMLDAFTSSLKGLVPASGGGTSTFLRADATWQTPPDADHALVTSGAIPRGNGTTQVASLLSDDGSTVTNAGDTDLSAGQTTVGQVVVTVQTISTTGTISVVTLAADAAVLRLDGAGTVRVNSITGGVDGRVLIIEHPAGFLQLGRETTTGTTATDRIEADSTYSGSVLYFAALSRVVLTYSGSTSRWGVADTSYRTALTAQFLSGTSSLSSSGTLSVSGTATFNGDVVVGNAPTGGLTVNGHGVNVAIPIGRQIFTSSGTYTPTSGTYKVLIEVVGGGGGGGGSPNNSGGSSFGASGGGASGMYIKKWIDPGAAITGGTVTIGSGGSGGAVGTSGASGTYSEVTVQSNAYRAQPGAGGTAMSGTTAIKLVAGGAVDPVNGTTLGSSPAADVVAGSSGEAGVLLSTTYATSGAGGSNPLGSPGWGLSSTNAGVAASGYGAGGGGAINLTIGNTGGAGGDGAPGVVIIWEYR